MFLYADVSITYRKIAENWKISIPASLDSLISVLILDSIIDDLFRQDKEKKGCNFSNFSTDLPLFFYPYKNSSFSARV